MKFVYKAYNPVTKKQKTLKASNIEVARNKARRLLKGSKGVVRTYRVTKRYQR